MTSDETLDFSGTLQGENLPADWTGATGKITLTDARSGRKILNKVDLTSFDPVTRAWSFVDSSKTLPVGEYRISILITFSGGGTRDFPNGYNSQFRVEKANGSA